jgi:hypothetical protein
MRSILYTVKKVFSRDVTYHLPNSPVARGSLVSDIPYEDGKTANLFLQCVTLACEVPTRMWEAPTAAAVMGSASVSWCKTSVVGPSNSFKQNDVNLLFEILEDVLYDF